MWCYEHLPWDVWFPSFSKHLLPQADQTSDAYVGDPYMGRGGVTAKGGSEAPSHMIPKTLIDMSLWKVNEYLSKSNPF